ncbi:hypothetical protein Tcan_05754 [Toxocara canis]|uniref:Uncharacterized protein n=1 Tax=Toxocara canis TaxID=6265 RepID=A0A0B2VY68_TOXCA|nr:hypothetical protein Tcan_05754 [Toxocara canis]
MEFKAFGNSSVDVLGTAGDIHAEVERGGDIKLIHICTPFFGEHDISTSARSDLTERIFWESSFYEELKNFKEEFEEENHKKRVQLIKERLEEAKKDNWLRLAVGQLLRY